MRNHLDVMFELSTYSRISAAEWKGGFKDQESRMVMTEEDPKRSSPIQRFNLCTCNLQQASEAYQIILYNTFDLFDCRLQPAWFLVNCTRPAAFRGFKNRQQRALHALSSSWDMIFFKISWKSCVDFHWRSNNWCCFHLQKDLKCLESANK